MGERVLLAGRRRPYVFPAALAALCAVATFFTASAEGLPIKDPDGIGGPPLLRLSLILGVFIALDVLPRALHRAGWRLTGLWGFVREVIHERWHLRRTALVLVGLFSFYITYVAYRNFKGFLPFLRTENYDAPLMSLDKGLFGGHDPATLLHEVLGTGIANQFFSAVYVIYLAFVPVSLAAALVWWGDMRHGLWYATALCLNWVLGAASYYILPSMGPAFVAPQLFSDLPPSASSSLQHSLWTDRLGVLWTNAGEEATSAVQSIAAFASLHVSVVLTAALVAQMLRSNRWLRWGLWTYLFLVIVSTIYLGWHYVIDDVAGVAIGLLATAVGAWATGHGFRVWPRRDAHERTTSPPRVLNTPNALSMVRILLAPAVAAIVLAHPDGSVFAAALFAAGGLTDVIDGHLARTRGLVTSVGKLLDPVADKLLVVAALASLVAVDRLALGVAVVIVAREVLVTCLRAYALRRGVMITAGPAGKAKMALQVAMVLVLMAVADPFAAWVQLLVAATVALTVTSGLVYVRAYARSRRRLETDVVTA